MKYLFLLLLSIVTYSEASNHYPYFPKRDLGQCDRRCVEVFGAGVISARERFSKKQECLCYKGYELMGSIGRFNTDLEIPSPEGVVCGADGNEYPDAQTAATHGTTSLHAGHCGQCSNTHDIQIYKDTAGTLTRTSEKCAMLMTFLGVNAATFCMNRKVGFTSGCTECWINNMSCSIAHCRKECFHSTLQKQPNNVGGKLNDCLACDEKYCGGMFIKCAGVNRRRAGIISDIQRPNDQVWEEAQ